MQLGAFPKDLDFEAYLKISQEMLEGLGVKRFVCSLF